MVKKGNPKKHRSAKSEQRAHVQRVARASKPPNDARPDPRAAIADSQAVQVAGTPPTAGELLDSDFDLDDV